MVIRPISEVSVVLGLFFVFLIVSIEVICIVIVELLLDVSGFCFFTF